MYKEVFATLTETEARACYDAIAQWHDNTREYVEDERSEGKEPKGEAAGWDLVGAVVHRVESAIAKSVEEEGDGHAED